MVIYRFTALAQGFALISVNFNIKLVFIEYLIKFPYSKLVKHLKIP